MVQWSYGSLKQNQRSLYTKDQFGKSKGSPASDTFSMAVVRKRFGQSGVAKEPMTCGSCRAADVMPRAFMQVNALSSAA
jgi:hypothetical protein